jgi:hypothetical protein
MDCTKYLTACAGCTKKHAKCAWNDISEEEVAYLDGGLGHEDEDLNANMEEPAVELHTKMDPGLNTGNAGLGEGQNAGSEASTRRGNLKLDASPTGHGNGRNIDIRDADTFLSPMASAAAASTAQ